MGFAEFFTLIKDWFGSFVALIFVVWVVVAWALLQASKTSKDQARFRNWASRMHRPYKALMNRVMVRLERLLMPLTVEEDPLPERLFDRIFWSVEPLAKDQQDVERLRGKPWSWPVLSVAMLVAVAYPLVFALMQWIWVGDAVGFGDLRLFPYDVHWAVRWGLFLALCIWIWENTRRPALFGNRPEILRYGLLITFLSTYALTGVLAVAVACTTVITTTGGIRGAFALSLALASTIAFALAGVFSITFPDALKSAVAIAGLMVLPVIVSKWTRNGFGVFAHLSLLVVGGGIAFFSIFFEHELEILPVLFALGLLPCLNAFFDWLSYGMTIFLLQKGQAKRGVWPLLCGVADVVAAGVIFAALAASLVAILAQINLWRGDILVDVRAILDQPGEHLWVVAMIASTLVPTLVHLGLALFSLITWVPVPFWQRGVDRLLDQEDTMGGWWAAARLSGALVGVYGGFLLLGGAVLWALWQFGAVIVSGYVGWLHVLLDWIGSPVVPVVT